MSALDWKLLGTTFITIFLAELGDKTQLATLTFSSGGPHTRWPVFLGSAGALVATSALAVLGGEGLSRLISPALLKQLSGVAFILIGVWVLWASRGAP
jgi:putative Ca2+/H+ antiporter (TMEM165/GDT1 family)